MPQAAKTAYLQSRVPLHTKLPTDDPQFFSKQLQAGLARVKGIGSKEKAEHALEQRMKIYDPKVRLLTNIHTLAYLHIHTHIRILSIYFLYIYIMHTHHILIYTHAYI